MTDASWTTIVQYFHWLAVHLFLHASFCLHSRSGHLSYGRSMQQQHQNNVVTIPTVISKEYFRREWSRTICKLSKNHRDLSCGWPWIFWGSARLTPRLLPNHATYLDNPAGAQYLNTSEKIFCHLRRIASVRYQTKPLAKAIFRGLRNCKLSNYLNICMYCTRLEFATISSGSKPVGPPQ